jgi:hypothetical protein
LKGLLEEHDFEISNTRYLTHDFAALFENYLSSIFNWVAIREKKRVNKPGTVSSLGRYLFHGAHSITKMLTYIDTKLFGNASRSVGIAVSARKNEA